MDSGANTASTALRELMIDMGIASVHETSRRTSGDGSTRPLNAPGGVLSACVSGAIKASRRITCGWLSPTASAIAPPSECPTSTGLSSPSFSMHRAIVRACA